MTFAELFDSLLADRTLIVRLLPAEAETLRVRLLKRFAGYKEEMNSYGFLDPELAELSLSCKRDKEAGTATFSLIKKHVRTYEIITVTNSPNDVQKES